MKNYWVHGMIAFAVALCGAILRIAVLCMHAFVKDKTFLSALRAWDSEYYLQIAQNGYFDAQISNQDVPAHEVTLAFFPGYPMLVRAVSFLTGMGTASAAFVVSFISLVALTWGTVEIADRMGAKTWAKVGAAIAVTCAPMAIVFSMPYTEALFGALVAWALVAMIDRRWLLAGGLIFLLGFVRLTSVGMVATLGLMVLVYGRRNWRAWLAVFIAPLSLLMYILWANSHLQHVGGYFGTQAKHWHSQFDFGAATLRWGWKALTESDQLGYGLSVLVMLAVPVLLFLTWRKIPWPVWVFCAVLTANVLLSDGIMHSRPRLLLPAAMLLIPVVIKLDELGNRRVYVTVLAGWVMFGAWFSAYMLTPFQWAI